MIGERNDNNLITECRNILEPSYIRVIFATLTFGVDTWSLV